MHLINIFELQIQTCFCVVVTPGYISTSPAVMRSSASHPAGLHGRLSHKTVNRTPITEGGSFDTIRPQIMC